jgi:hypothetical protein
MGTLFDVHPDTGLALNGPLFAVSDQLLVGVLGNTLRILHGPTGAQAMTVAAAVEGVGNAQGFTALTAQPALGCVPREV